MSSFIGNAMVPYMTSPLANSTKISNNKLLGTESSYATYSHLYRSPGLNRKKSISKDADILEKNIIDREVVSTTSMIVGTSKENDNEKKCVRKSVGSKKPVVGRKLMPAKKPIEPIKAVAVNYQDRKVTVERILKQINMTKYYQAFKKIDVEKFKEMREIDLNAIGITRPSEIRIFMEAIRNTKSDLKYYVLKD